LFGGGAAQAPQLPIVLSRNGKDFKITGNQSTVRSGIEILVKTERPEVSFSLSEMNKDSWIIFELPGFANASAGTKLDSLDALRKATETSYVKTDKALWVKLVVPQDPGVPILPTVSQTRITASR
jgi:cell migration-inducing and hyaluronan-binding protein